MLLYNTASKKLKDLFRTTHIEGETFGSHKNQRKRLFGSTYVEPVLKPLKVDDGNNTEGNEIDFTEELDPSCSQKI